VIDIGWGKGMAHNPPECQVTRRPHSPVRYLVEPGLVAQLDGATLAVYAFGIAGDRITHIWAIPNPDKLRPWTTG
jgi:hypothetical protein